MLAVGCGTSYYVLDAYARRRQELGAGITRAAIGSELDERGEHDVVLLLSRSGTTSDLLRAAERFAGRVPTVAVVGDPDTPLPGAVDTSLLLPFADERSVVQTRFATTALALLRHSLGEDVEPAAADAEAALAAPLAAEPLAFAHVVFLGTGWTLGVAHEAALKCREAALMFTEAYAVGEYQHGPIALAGGHTLVWSFAPLPAAVRAGIDATGATRARAGVGPARRARRRPPARGGDGARQGPGPRSPPAPQPLGRPGGMSMEQADRHGLLDAPERAPARSHYRAMGIDPERLRGPVIGIATTWTGTMPCNLTQRALAQHVAAGVEAAGGVALEFNTIAVSDNLTMGTPRMSASLVSRELIADSIELVGTANPFDGLVCLVGCDKTVPGAIMALARLDLPGLVLSSGPKLPGRLGDRELSVQDVYEAVGEHAAGRMGDDELAALERAACPGPGTCAGQFTANTMAVAVDFLGLGAPFGAGLAPALLGVKQADAHAAGRLAVDAVRRGARPSGLLDARALRNAIAAVAATGGSTNAVLHLLAIAGEAGVALDLDAFDAISAATPVLASLKPGGDWLAADFHRAGSTPALAAALLGGGWIDGSAPTVDGRTLAEIAAPERRRPGRARAREPAVQGRRRARGAARQPRPGRRRGQAGGRRAPPPRGARARVRRRARRARRRAGRRDRARRRRGHPRRGPRGRARDARDAVGDGGDRRPRARRLRRARDGRPLQRRDARADGRPRRARGRARRPARRPARGGHRGHRRRGARAARRRRPGGAARAAGRGRRRRPLRAGLRQVRRRRRLRLGGRGHHGGGMSPGDEDTAALVRACRARDYNEEGIEMLLLLEDATGATAAPQDDEDRRLTALVAGHLERLAADPARPTPGEVALALEVTASRHFAPPDA